ncbi:MAG TPA: response regulator [Gemmatimonadales bacterium]|jgi:DNA-binding response OmpR family regulator
MAAIVDAVRVLVADDDPTVRLILAERLASWGFDVVTVEDGVAALEALRGPNAPSIALLDWMMPEMNGPEVCRRISSSAMSMGRYLILLTARGGAANVAEGLNSGADDFITKPCDDRELRARLCVAARVVRLENQLHERVAELQEALANVERLEALLPICSYCHSVRHDDDYWQRLDQYVARYGVTFSHGICPSCFETHMEPQLASLEAGEPG